MARKTTKRLNKGLVAALTIFGMLLTVAAVGVIARQGARQDPEKFARAAIDAERLNDYPRAIGFYRLAFNASEPKNLTYLHKASKIAFDMGEWGAWLQLLKLANSQDPKDAATVKLILDGAWELADSGSPPAEILAEYGNKLDAIEPGQPLAAIAIGAGYQGDKDSGNDQEVESWFKKAWEAEPTQPRVAIIWYEVTAKALSEEYRKRGSDKDPALRSELITKIRATADQILGPAAAAHPTDHKLISFYAIQLADTGAAAAGIALLERAVAADSASADLHMALGRALLQDLGRRSREAAEKADAAAVTDEERRLVADRVRAEAQAALAIDKAAFDAYLLLASTSLPPLKLNPDAQDFDAALKVYEEGRKDTLMLRNKRAAMYANERLGMLVRGFAMAMALMEKTAAGTQSGSDPKILERAKAFVDDAELKFTKYGYTLFMRGDYSAAARDYRTALQAYKEAGEALRGDPKVVAAAWNRQFQRQPGEQLAVIFGFLGEWGEAERYARDTIQTYRQVLGLVPPRRVREVLVRALLGTGVTKEEQQANAKKALEELDQIARDFKIESDPAFAALRVNAYQRLEREDEASAALEGLEGSVSKDLLQAQVMINAGNAAAAEERLRETLLSPVLTIEEFEQALRFYAQAATRAERTAEAAKFVSGLKSRPLPKGGQADLAQMLCDGYAAFLGEPDPAKRRAALAAVFQTDKDETRRTGRMAALYLQSDNDEDFERGLAALDQFEKLKPDDRNVKFDQFSAALRKARKARTEMNAPGATAAQIEAAKKTNAEQIAKAKRYLALLVTPESSYDGAGGALLRGEIAMAEEAYEAAAAEFEEAVEVLPRNSDVFVKLARARLGAAGRDRAKNEAALTNARYALEINPREFDALLIGMLAAEQIAAQADADEVERLEAQLDEMQARAAAIYAEHPEVRRVGQMIQDRKSPLEAIARREARRTADPQDADNLMELGRLYVRQVRLALKQKDAEQARAEQEKADAAFAQATAAAPSSYRVLSAALDYYGDTRQIKKAEAAQAEFAKAITEKKQWILAQLALARAYERVYMQTLDDPSPEGRTLNQESAEKLAAVFNQLQKTDIDQAFAEEKDRNLAQAHVSFAVMDIYRGMKGLGWAPIVEETERLLGIIGKTIKPGEDSKIDSYRKMAKLLNVEALLNLGKLPEAEAALTNYQLEYKGDLRGMRLAFDVALRMNKRADALSTANEYLRQRPDDAGMLFNRGMLAGQSGNYELARQDFEGALKNAKNEDFGFMVRSRLALTLENAQRMDESLAQLDLMRRKLLLAEANLKPNIAEQRQVVVDRMLKNYRAQRRPEKDHAEDWLQKSLALLSDMRAMLPDEGYWPFRTGRLLEQSAELRERPDEKKSDYRAANNYFGQAVELFGGKNDPKAAVPLAAQITALSKSDDPKQALILFDSINPDTAKHVVLVAGATAYAQAFADSKPPNKEYREKALANFKRGLLLANEDALMQPALVVASQIRGVLKLEDAEDLLRNAAGQFAPESQAGARLNLALLIHLVGSISAKPEQAEARLAEAISLAEAIIKATASADPIKSPGLFAAWCEAQVQLGDLMSAKGDIAAAEKAYTAVIERKRDHVVALNNLAWLLATKAKRPQDALRYARAAHDLASDYNDRASILDTAGYVYLLNNRLEDAKGALKEALGIDPTTWASYRHLIEVADKMAAANRGADGRELLAWALKVIATTGKSREAKETEEQLKVALSKLPG